MMKMAIYLCGLPLKNTLPQSNHEKNIRQIPTEEDSVKYQYASKLSKSSKQGKSKKLTAQRNLRRQLNTV